MRSRRSGPPPRSVPARLRDRLREHADRIVLQLAAHGAGEGAADRRPPHRDRAVDRGHARPGPRRPDGGADGQRLRRVERSLRRRRERPRCEDRREPVAGASRAVCPRHAGRRRGGRRREQRGQQQPAAGRAHPPPRDAGRRRPRALAAARPCAARHAGRAGAREPPRRARCARRRPASARGGRGEGSPASTRARRRAERAARRRHYDRGHERFVSFSFPLSALPCLAAPS